MLLVTPVMTQLIWNSAKDEVWLQTFKASEDVPTHAARPAVSEFAVTVQSQKSHKLHTWAHNCRHTPVSLKFKAGVKPIKGHFISFLLLGGVWASTIKATSTSAGASTSRGPCQPFEKGNARASVIPWHHTVPVVLECAGLKTNPQPGQYWNSKPGQDLSQASHKLQSHTRRRFPRCAQASPGSRVHRHRRPSDLGWPRSRGRQSSGMLLDTSANSWHSLVFILKAAESKRQKPSNNDSEVIGSNTCTRATITVTGYLNW